ncbi:MAG: aminoacyl-tRNA hydrolase [Patescibacteria group bacterium]|nr:aminoacyl-tRNA hydrolase [Patescibacteria group bacterium]
MKIIIGLGNPGDKYALSRHNAGWLALDMLAGADGWRAEKKFNALIKETGGDIYLKPLTFMNKSGESAYKSLRYYHLLEKQFGCLTKKNQDLRDCLIVIQDDLDLDLGKWKISDDSRSGGNKGIQSIINHLKTQRFIRLRLGIKNGELRRLIPPEKFVLQKFGAEEMPILQDSIKNGLTALQSYIK